MEQLNSAIRVFLKQYPNTGEVSVNIIITDLTNKGLKSRVTAPNATLVLGHPTELLIGSLTGEKNPDFKFVVEAAFSKGEAINDLNTFTLIARDVFYLMNKASEFLKNPYNCRPSNPELTIVGYGSKRIVKSDHKDFGGTLIQFVSNRVPRDKCPASLLPFLV